VGKGKTSRPSDAEEWIEEYYEVEAVIEDPAEFEVAKAELKGLVDGWLSSSSSKPATPAAKPSDELEKLPWKTYKSKADCKPDEAGWIFRNTQGAETLAALINREGKKTVVQIGAYKFEVKFSGAEKQFIGRSLLKLKTELNQEQMMA
jgi:hypothetical protein